MQQNQASMEMGIVLNTTSEDEHEYFIERFNQFIKEKCRMCYSTLSFLRMPRQMTAKLVYFQIYWIGFFVDIDYISATLSPGAVVTCRVYDYNMICGPGS